MSSSVYEAPSPGEQALISKKSAELLGVVSSIEN